MSHEPRSNMAYVCALHAPRPDPRYAHADPATLVGWFVKRAFPVRFHPERHEHMWCEVLRVCEDGTLEGRLDNDPALDVGYVCGNLIGIRLDEIEAVLSP